MMVALSPTFCFSSSSTGFIILQGPHHSAKKSTSTGLSCAIISENVFCFVVSIIWFVLYFLLLKRSLHQKYNFRHSNFLKRSQRQTAPWLQNILRAIHLSTHG